LWCVSGVVWKGAVMLWVKAARMSIEGRAAAACSGRNPLLPPTQMEPPTSPESNPRTVGTLHQPSEAIPPYPLLAINVSSLLRLAPLTVHVPSPCWLPAGAEELKERLAGLGLKCGGTPRQRAERLWALRGSSLEALDPKHFAKGAAPTAAAANPEEVAKRQQVSVFWWGLSRGQTWHLVCSVVCFSVVPTQSQRVAPVLLGGVQEMLAACLQ
jgi:hypothetical protein